jgi:molybdopterin converting factor small subunit
VSVEVRFFYPALQSLFGGTEPIRAEGRTVGECLADLVGREPGAEKLLFGAKGALLRHVYVYVNAESMFKAEMGKPIGDGDALIIAVLASGG